MKKQKNILPFIIAPILILGGGYFLFSDNKSSNNNADPTPESLLAKCLTEKGVKMYGAFWCPHCQQQKKDFGKAFDQITYIECSPGGNRNAFAQECKDASIQGYPTWVFADGSRVNGEQPLLTLAEKAGCTYIK